MNQHAPFCIFLEAETSALTNAITTELLEKIGFYRTQKQDTLLVRVKHTLESLAQTLRDEGASFQTWVNVGLESLLAEGVPFEEVTQLMILQRQQLTRVGLKAVAQRVANADESLLALLALFDEFFFTISQFYASQTAKALAQTQLLNSELAHQATELRLFRALAEIAPDGVAVSDLTGKFIYCNPAQRALMGYDPVAKQTNLSDAFVLDHPGQLEGMVATALSEGFWQGIIPYRRADGTTFAGNLSGFVIRTPDGQPCNLAGIVRDESAALQLDEELRQHREHLEDLVAARTAEMAATNHRLQQEVAERERVEHSLRKSEEQIRTVLEFTYDWEYWMDAEGMYLYVSPACERITGHPPAEFLANPNLFGQLIHPDDQEIVQKHLEDEAKQRIPASIDFRLISQQGEERWISHVCQPVFNDNGRWIGTHASNLDVSEHKQVEKEIIDWKRRYELIVSASGQIVYDYNIPTGVILWSGGVEQVLGYSLAEMQNGFQQWVDLIHPEDRIETIRALELAEQTGEFFDVIYRYRHKAGHYLWVYDRGFFGLDAKGQAISMLGMMQDISERKRLETQVQELLLRRMRQVQTSTDIAQQISTASSLTELFKRVIALAQERFDYSHIQVFRADAGHHSLTLVAATGEVGQRMQDAGCTVEFGKGLIGQTVLTKQPILVSEVQQSAIYLPSPYLPQTKGELAIPIIFRGEVLGVLDVQTNQANLLSQEDEVLLLGLCGQIASAINSTKLLEDANIFRLFSDAAGQGLGIAGLEGNVVYMNPSLYRLLGAESLSDVLGKSVASFYPPELQELLANEVIPTVIQKDQWVGEMDLINEAGTTTTTIQNVFLIRDDLHQPRYIANVVTDISGQKQIEAEIRQQVAEQTAKLTIFRALVEHAPDGIAVRDLKGEFIYTNPAFHTMIGYDSATHPTNMREVIVLDSPSQIDEMMDSLVQKGIWKGILTYQRADGTTFDGNLSSFAIRGPDGQPCNIGGIVRDITEEKRAAAERAQLQETIIQMQEATLRELSSPLMPIADAVVVMPLIGTINSRRANQVMETLLEGIVEHQAELAILDITGVPAVDAQVAQVLVQMAKATRLLGAQVIITGIQPTMALLLLDLEVNLEEIVTLSSLQKGIAYALKAQHLLPVSHSGR